MIKVSDVVRELTFSSETALSALSDRCLNLSAFAKKIKPEVERRARKPVSVGSIVIALSRLAGALEEQEPLLPEVALENLSVKSGLVEITFDKTRENRERLQNLFQDKSFVQADFFTLTHGIGELSIVVPEPLAASVLAIYKNQKPKLVLSNLASLTVCFDEKYLLVPNVIYALLRPLALKRIDVVEIVSTFTELTFLLHQRDLNEAFVTINRVFQEPAI